MYISKYFHPILYSLLEFESYSLSNIEGLKLPIHVVAQFIAP